MDGIHRSQFKIAEESARRRRRYRQSETLIKVNRTKVNKHSQVNVPIRILIHSGGCLPRLISVVMKPSASQNSCAVLCFSLFPSNDSATASGKDGLEPADSFLFPSQSSVQHASKHSTVLRMFVRCCAHICALAHANETGNRPLQKNGERKGAKKIRAEFDVEPRIL